jgi:DnaJ-class molecular chaperone
LGDLFGKGGAGGPSLDELLRQFGGFAQRQPRRGQAAAPEEAPGDLNEEITIPFGTAVLGGQYQLQWSRGGKPESISIKIPAGIEAGQSLRLRGQGPAGPRGRRGDIIVKVHVAPHPHFERRGNNLHVVVPISLVEAVQGAKLDLPTPHGTITITVPPLSSSGRQLRLRGMGIRPEGKPPGDLLAELQIELPQDLSQEQREKLAEWASSVSGSPNRRISW